MEHSPLVLNTLADCLPHYIDCALWSSPDDSGDPLDYDYNSDDLAPLALNIMREDCLAFLVEASHLLPAYLSIETAAQLGHDFWLTRNSHGAGFWDRDLGKLGEDMSHIAKLQGTCDLYACEEQIHIQ